MKSFILMLLVSYLGYKVGISHAGLAAKENQGSLVGHQVIIDPSKNPYHQFYSTYKKIVVLGQRVQSDGNEAWVEFSECKNDSFLKDHDIDILDADVLIKVG